MKALITDGVNAGRIQHISESKIDFSDVLEKDQKTGAYRMTEADAQWFGKQLREGYEDSSSLEEKYDLPDWDTLWVFYKNIEAALGMDLSSREDVLDYIQEQLSAVWPEA